MRAGKDREREREEGRGGERGTNTPEYPVSIDHTSDIKLHYNTI